MVVVWNDKTKCKQLLYSAVRSNWSLRVCQNKVSHNTFKRNIHLRTIETIWNLKVVLEVRECYAPENTFPWADMAFVAACGRDGTTTTLTKRGEITSQWHQKQAEEQRAQNETNYWRQMRIDLQWEVERWDLRGALGCVTRLWAWGWLTQSRKSFLANLCIEMGIKVASIPPSGFLWPWGASSRNLGPIL